MSGVEVSEELRDVFTLMKEKKQHQGLAVAITTEKVSAEGKKTVEKQIWHIVESMPRVTGEGDKHNQKHKEELQAQYEAFMDKHLKEFPVMLFLDFTSIEFGKRTVGIQWCPDDCKVKDRMVFSSSLNPLKGVVQDWVKFLQTSDRDDVTFNKLFELAKH